MRLLVANLYNKLKSCFFYLYLDSQFEIEVSESLTWMVSPNDPNIIFVVQRKELFNDELEVDIKLRPAITISLSSG